MFTKAINFDSGVFTDAEKEKYYQYKNLHDLLINHGLTDQEADDFYTAKNNIINELESINPFEEDFFIDDHDHGLNRAIAELEKLKKLCNKIIR